MMVINRGDINKRKRKDDCRSIFLDDSPKRTKVHAQRKFAQGSSMSSPVITPIKEIERQERTKPEVLPEPTELLPIKRPNTEDFLTFLCFRGTPVLPPNLNFFNTASASESKSKPVDNVKEPKNGPIATATITKAADGTEEKPFIAFGVRKRADPVVISKQMDKKRRHALALQALRRKYQEQRMAKIRAVTISSLSEKVTQKPVVRTTRSVTKNETVAKKDISGQTKYKVITTEQVKPKKKIQQPIKTNVKPKMCLRSFRGRFIHHELKFKTVKKKTVSSNIKMVKKQDVKKKEPSSDFSSDDDQPLVKTVKEVPPKTKAVGQTAKKTAKKPIEVKLTRSSSGKISLRRHQLRQRLLQQKVNTKTAPALRIISKPNLRKLTEKGKQQKAKKQALVQELRNRRVLKKDDEFPKKADEKEVPKRDTSKLVVAPQKNVTKEEPSVSQRPTRKTKEAAAIYMEILGHKLVSEGKNDDDNVSIDSFPELPNVRRTEQRENELKARAKVNDKKGSVSKSELSNEKSKIKESKSVKVSETVKKISPEQKIMTRNKSQLLQIESKTNKIDTKMNLLNEAKATKSRNRRIELEAIKASMIKAYDTSSDSEGSFEENIIPKVKKLRGKESYRAAKATDSGTKQIKEKSNKIDIETAVKTDIITDKSIDPDKIESNFNDSDEEPLSKFTLVKSSSSIKSNVSTQKKLTIDLNRKTGKDTKPVISCKKERQSESNSVEKPKRECTKKPHSYLFSSSDDDEKYFHGFVETSSERKLKNIKNESEYPIPIVASADLLRKDVGKRFGKGKVNMSNEQIEKWLKDSAMAGSSMKTEDDEMIKYGDSIPTETTFDLNLMCTINTDNLRSSILTETDIVKHIEKRNLKTEIKQKPPESPSSSSTSVSPLKQTPLRPVPLAKPYSNDRKPIFRKERQVVPNVKAFSASNECSVYAFGEENEDTISTPFRRPMRRPSSTATSRSEDDSCKQEDSNKSSGKFRMPINKPDTLKIANKQEVSLLLSTDDSASTSIAVQVNLESSEPVAESINLESGTPTETAENNEQLFYIPLQPAKQTSSQLIQGVTVKLGTELTTGANQRVVMRAKLVTQSPGTSQQTSKMCPPVHALQKHKSSEKIGLKMPITPKSVERNSETSEDSKYKVPSSPSASSSSSAKICSRRQSAKPKTRAFEVLTPVSVNEFPSVEGPAQIVEAPTFHPNDKEFQDPIEYIEKIRQTAEQFGICRIVPPSNFKPECKVSDDMRFTAYNQYVHKMLHRWGPNFKELMAIQKYLETQNITLTHPPWIGGMEIDLPRLYQTVQSLGGLKEVIEKKKWPKVSEIMRIPKSAQDRVTKLDDIYCKYLLPYDTLSPAEREKLFDEVETEWAKRESKSLLKAQEKINNQTSPTSESDSDSDNEIEECIVKGRNMALNAFYRIARNTMSMWFRNSDPAAQEVEQEFWKHVTLRQNHICVHSGSIDSGSWGYGFAVSKNSPFARHAWNLKVLTNNSGSVLRSMGPIMGVTVPTLHVGMVFSACCWYRDPHHLPWIEYLHAGANKIWYGVPDSMSNLFHAKLTKLVPNYCRNKSLWLPSDTAMVPPSILVENGVSLCRTVQQPGQYVVVFPKAFTCSLSTGYVVSESVYFAPPQWLTSAEKAFEELRNSCEPSMFSLDRLLLSIVADVRSSVEVLKLVTPLIEVLCVKEKNGRDKLKKMGVVASERVPLPEVVKKKKKLQDDDYECEVCRKNLFVTMVTESQEDGVYCLDHAAEYITQQKIQSKHCKLLYTYDDQELGGMIGKLKSVIENKSQKKVPGKYAGMPTLLNRQ